MAKKATTKKPTKKASAKKPAKLSPLEELRLEMTVAVSDFVDSLRARAMTSGLMESTVDAARFVCDVVEAELESAQDIVAAEEDAIEEDE